MARGDNRSNSRADLFGLVASGLVRDNMKKQKSNTELTSNELDKVIGGADTSSASGGYPTVQILQAAMAHRESIRSSFESQRATLVEAIEAQRQAMTQAVNNTRRVASPVVHDGDDACRKNE